MSTTSSASCPFVDPKLLEFVAEQLDANAVIRAQAANLGLPGSVEPARIRRGRIYNRDGSFRPALDDTAVDRQLRTASGDVLVRSFAGADTRTAIVHFHGGGWTFGSVYEQDAMLASLAARTGATVHSVDYPLAPESELPYAIKVAIAALIAIVDAHPEHRIAVIGESAGAHIALSSVVRKPDLRQRICAMSLAYGIYDLSMTPSQRAWGNEFLGLSTPWLEYFYGLALPGRSRDERSDPQFSPLYANLADLPPTIFSVGELDPLLDDTLFLHQRWLNVGNAGKLCVYPQAPHGFNHLPTRMASRCNEAVAAFLTAEFAKPL